MAIPILVVCVVVLGYAVLTFPTRRRRREWMELKKSRDAPPIEVDINP
jgi:hypothetical protein